MLTYYYISDWGTYQLRYHCTNDSFHTKLLNEDGIYIAKQLEMDYKDLCDICENFNGNTNDKGIVFFNRKEDAENAIITLKLLSNN